MNTTKKGAQKNLVPLWLAAELFDGIHVCRLMG